MKRPLAVIAGLLAVGAFMLWRLGPSAKPQAPGRAAFEPRRAYEEGMELIKQRRFVESLPILRSVAEAEPGISQVHHDYAAAMLNAVHQPRRHLGRDEFAVRSSVERIALVNQAMVELMAAERSAGPNARARAWAERTRAQAFGAWGFPWEALVGYRRMEAADPSWTEMVGRAKRLLMELEHPERAPEAHP